MNLTDILPCNANELFELAHINLRTEKTEERCDRLKPFADYFKKCLEECGSLTGDPRLEYGLTMTAISIVDMMIERYYSKDVV